MACAKLQFTASCHPYYSGESSRPDLNLNCTSKNKLHVEAGLGKCHLTLQESGIYPYPTQTACMFFMSRM